MSSGDWPDYQEYVLADLFTQTLEVIKERPLYGIPRRKLWEMDVTPNTKNKLISISGKGLFFCLNVYARPETDQDTDLVQVYFDEELSQENIIADFRTYHMYAPVQYTLFATHITPLCTEYSIWLQGIQSFDKSIEVYYTETKGNTFRVYGWICYSFIT